MNKVVLSVSLILAGVVVALGINIFPPNEFQKDQLSEDILARSRGYIQKLEEKPLAGLSTENKLLLLHSYYNVNDYAAVIRVAESMPDELKRLPPERQKAFLEMLEEARRNFSSNR